VGEISREVTRSPYVRFPGPPIFSATGKAAIAVEIACPSRKGHEAMSLVKRSTGGHLMSDVNTRTRTRTKVSRRRSGRSSTKVILINDDYTPREFVVVVLKAVFRMSEDQAYRVMVHGAPARRLRGPPVFAGTLPRPRRRRLPTPARAPAIP